MGIRHYDVIEFNIENNQLHPRQKLTADQKKGLDFGYAIYVYRSTGKKQIYIGQTTKFNTRHKQHYNGNEKRFVNARFNEVIVLFYSKANGSSQNDIENQLITFFNADNPHGTPYKITNETGGNEVISYADMDFIAHNVLLPFWDEYLYGHKWVKSKQTKLRESALVKYSPLKTLSPYQQSLINRILADPGHNYVINGDAGTGKTVLLTHLTAQMLNAQKNVCVIVQPNCVECTKEIFKIYGMRPTVTTPTRFIRDFVHPRRAEFDAIIIDEAHRLFRDYRRGIAANWVGIYEGDFEDCKSHLEIIQRAAGTTSQIILMYDVLQAVRPSCITREMFASLTAGYSKEFLKTQFRIKAPAGKSYTADDYINGIKYLLYKDTGLLDSGYTQFNPEFNRDVFRDPSPDAYFGFFEDHPLANSYQWITERGIYNPSDSNRVLAGYVEPWRQAHGKDPNIKHWKEGNLHLRWNSSQKDWINSPDKDAKDQVGSVYAVQGIDLNRAAVLIGPDLVVGSDGHLKGSKKGCKDRNTWFNQRDYDNNQEECDREFTLFILNCYYILLTRGIDAVRVGFWKDNGKPTLLEYMKRTLEIES